MLSQSHLASLVALLALLSSCQRVSAAASTTTVPARRPPASQNTSPRACFLLHELGVGVVRQAPSTACQMRLTPASTFKIPHALAALDAEVLDGPDARIAYDGTPKPFPVWQRDHTLASALRHSVVWYFQEVAEHLGEAREREYLNRFHYGNADSTSGLASFWLGGSLLISPEEQAQFLVRLYENSLPVSQTAMQTVREMLVQPKGVIVNASGAQAFIEPWPEGTVLSAKTGNGSMGAGGSEVRWLVAHVAREHRSWVFVSCVTGRAPVAALAAVDLAALSLREARVL